MKATPLTLLWMAGALAATAALALDLPDPTRPPYAATPGPNAGAAVQGGGAGMGNGVMGAAQSGAGATGMPRAAVARSARLSAVLMADAPGRHAAVIDGVVRHVGDRLSEGTVSSITPDAVTLKGQGHTTRLSLYDRDPEPVALAASQAQQGKGRATATLAAATRPTVSPPDGAPDPAKEQP
jgi:hypothetical protein